MLSFRREVGGKVAEKDEGELYARRVPLVAAWPGFSEHKFDLEHEDLVGDIAHIKGRRPGAARYDRIQSVEDNRSSKNLIALCKKHHTIIDGNSVHLYPVSKLREMKLTHEEKIANYGDCIEIKSSSSTHR